MRLIPTALEDETAISSTFLVLVDEKKEAKTIIEQW